MSRMERYHNKSETPEVEVPLNNKQKTPKKPKKVSGKQHRGSVTQSVAKALLLLVILILAFCFYEYNKGFRAARQDQEFGQIDVDKFNGTKSSDGSINVLLLGSDSRGEDQGRSDSIMVAHYNKNSKEPKLVSIMRDTYVNIPGVGYNKMNAAYAYGGPELVRQTLKETFNMDIEYYAIVNFATFPKIVDTLLPKGVEIDGEKELEVEGTVIQQGLQKMDGHQALQYARFRKDADSDFGRVRRQQQVMNAIISQGTSFGNFYRIPEAMGKVQGYLTTNVPAKIYPSIAKDFVLGSAKPLASLVVPTRDKSWDNYYADAGSVLEIDEAAYTQEIADFLR